MDRRLKYARLKHLRRLEDELRRKQEARPTHSFARVMQAMDRLVEVVKR